FFAQSNREYEIIDWIHEARGTSAGIVINPGAFTHTSVAILDA
ncbi:type II 3-dehydroquinate dehydratase, partial [Rhizobium sp. BR5]